MQPIRSLVLAICMLPVAMAQPVINLAGNAASYDTAVARGSMVVLIGGGLGPSPIQVADSFPLMTTLADVSVHVTVNGVTTDGIMYYASDGQTAFVLDSDTPAGTGIVTLTYNGQTSAAFPITVVDSNLGFYTLDASGSGPGVVTFHESVQGISSLFPSETNAVNPGDLVILWANGLGPVPFDETIGAEFMDLTDVPLQLFVNGQQVETFYQGRSPGCCSSVDNIYFYWPQAAQGTSDLPIRAANSCSSTISAQIGNMTSNLVTVPSADVGTRVCGEAPPPGGGDAATPLDSIISPAELDQLIQKGEVTFGLLGLTRETDYTRDFEGTTMEQLDGGIGLFAEFNQNLDEAVAGIDRYLGSEVCTTSVSTSNSDIDFFGVNYNTLDAGPGFLVNGPNGQNGLNKFSFGGQSVYTGQFPAGYLAQGAYTIESPMGGADVGPIMATAQVSSPLDWTNRQQLLTVVRNNGFTVTWTGPTSGWVTVSGESSEFDFATRSFTTKSFSCTARATQGSIMVPGNIAAVVDASNALAFQFGQLSVGAIQIFDLPDTGLDLSVFTVTDNITQDVEYQ